MPKLSVLMPAYNVQPFIGEAIESVLAQTFNDFELLILDDGSTDKTLEIVESYAKTDSRIRFFSSENQKVAKCLNALVAHARGDFVARMDADDICRPKRFERQLTTLLQDPSIGVVGCWVQTFGDKSEVWHYRKEDNFSRALIANGVTALCHPTWMLRTTDLVNLPYSDKYRFIIDRAWLAHFALNNPRKKILAIPEVLLDYRIHPQSVTGLYAHHMEEKTKLVLKEYYRKFGVGLSDDELTLFCHVIYAREVSAPDFEHAAIVYQKAFDAFEKTQKDEFYAFKEKWVRFCLANRKPFAFNQVEFKSTFIFFIEYRHQIGDL